MPGPLIVTVRRVLRSRGFRLLMLKVGPAVAAQAVNLARHGQWRQLAILHADSLSEGAFSREVLDDGAVHWIVWRGGHPVASYPPFDGPLERALEGHDPENRRAPGELPSRRARQASAERARAVGNRARSGAHRARSAGERVGRVVRRGQEDGAADGRTAGSGPADDGSASGDRSAGEGPAGGG